MSRGINNCNPGNIRTSPAYFRGEVRPSRDGSFKQFRSMEWGYRAIFRLLHTYTTRYGLNTIESMINRWAPPIENQTSIYVNFCADRVGQRPTDLLDTLDREPMLRLAAAISEIENGWNPPMEPILRGWELFKEDLES